MNVGLLALSVGCVGNEDSKESSFIPEYLSVEQRSKTLDVEYIRTIDNPTEIEQAFLDIAQKDGDSFLEHSDFEVADYERITSLNEQAPYFGVNGATYQNYEKFRRMFDDVLFQSRLKRNLTTITDQRVLASATMSITAQSNSIVSDAVCTSLIDVLNRVQKLGFYIQMDQKNKGKVLEYVGLLVHTAAKQGLNFKNKPHPAFQKISYKIELVIKAILNGDITVKIDPKLNGSSTRGRFHRDSGVVVLSNNFELNQKTDVQTLVHESIHGAQYIERSAEYAKGLNREIEASELATIDAVSNSGVFYTKSQEQKKFDAKYQDPWSKAKANMTQALEGIEVSTEYPEYQALRYVEGAIDNDYFSNYHRFTVLDLANRSLDYGTESEQYKLLKEKYIQDYCLNRNISIAISVHSAVKKGYRNFIKSNPTLEERKAYLKSQEMEASKNAERFKGTPFERHQSFRLRALTFKAMRLTLEGNGHDKLAPVKVLTEEILPLLRNEGLFKEYVAS